MAMDKYVYFISYCYFNPEFGVNGSIMFDNFIIEMDKQILLIEDVRELEFMLMTRGKKSMPKIINTQLLQQKTQ